MNCLVNNTSTSSKRSIYPPETKDLWVVDAWESKLKLNNGAILDDWASALGASTLGYGAFKPIFTPATSLPWQIEHDFAEEFCAAMGTEAVRFFKSGSDALSCAVRLARAFTGRDKVIVFDQSYHGTGDWFGMNLWTKKGIVEDNALWDYDFGKEIIEGKKWLQSIAAIVVEPVPKAIELPPAGWLQHLREVCNEHGIVLISDEVILGYRHSLRGFLDSQGIHADLTCFGKAMAQGAALSAVTGHMDLMEQLVKDVHFSGTNNGEPLPLQIAQWTLREYLEKDVCGILDQKGFNLKANLAAVGFETKGLNSRFEVVVEPEKKMDMTRFCFEHGILFPGFASIAVSHTEGQVERLVKTLVTWRDR
jgi:glutamate-1-semialdehyde aminotransferase